MDCIVSSALPEMELSVQSKLFISISNLSELKTYYTKTILVRQHFWVIKFSRADESEDASLKLEFFLKNGQEATFNWTIIAELSAKVASKKLTEDKLCVVSGPKVFDAFGETNSHTVFIQWPDLMDPEKGYVVDDTCIFKLKLKTSPIQNMSTNDFIKFCVESKCCDRTLNAKFCITVNNLAESYGICTPEFSLDDTQWRILFWRDKELHIFILKKTPVSSDYFRSATVFFKFMKNQTDGQKLVNRMRFHHSSMEHQISLMTWKQLLSQGFMKNGSFDIQVEIKFDVPGAPQPTPTLILCPICYESLTERDSSATICGHLFCTICIEKALAEKPNCPTCFRPIHVATRQVFRIYF